MADIFGRNQEDYTLRAALHEGGQLERYEAGNAARRPAAAPQHDFNALAGGVPAEFQRASEDQQAIGYLTNNLLAIQSVVDEVMYTAYRLPQFVHLNTGVPEGAQSYGVRVRDRVGRAARVSAPGWDAPSATASETIVTQPMHYYGLDAEWSVDELRGAMMGGTPLDTQSIEAAVMGSLETMEAVGLTGGGYDGATGLLNHATTGTDAVTLTTQGSNMTFSDLTSEQIRNLINGRISNVIVVSRETLGRNVNSGMTVYLPGEQYDLLTTRYIGDNAERTLMRSIMEDNPWTHFTKGSPLMIERVIELDSAINPGATTDRMIVGLKHERVAEMGVSISPRVLRIMDKGRVICAQVESKFSPLFVKRANTLQYTDAI